MADFEDAPLKLAILVARLYILAHLHLTSAKFDNEQLKHDRQNWWNYSANVENSQYELTVIYSDKKWVALDLKSEVTYAAE